MAARDYQHQLTSEARLGRPKGWLARLHLDPLLLLLLLVLTCAGMVILYSGSNTDIGTLERQAIRMSLAFVVMFAFAQIDPAVYRRWGPWIYSAGVIALIAVAVVGVGAKGAQRWLQLPGLPRVQPSEFMKIAMPLMAAWYLGSRSLPPRLGSTAVCLLLIIVPVALIVSQPDLGTGLLITVSGVFVLFLAGIRWRYIVAFAGLIGLAAPVMWFFGMREYQKQRVLTFLNPESDPLGSGWNIIQSKTAIGSGGFSGKGYLQGTQSHLDFLPESHTDFIVAVLAEEFGFMGVIALVVVYLLIVMRGLYIAAQAQDAFGRMLAGSLTLTFFIYAFVNMGMVSGLLPVVGVPLPLVSYGGTSIVTLMAAFGILMSIHTHRRFLTS
ncbi:MAG: rod shape-determining protein RodA [Alteromonadaceae bacterium]|nr:rod shape-determining protein RodA [Alteromonadaceae bacterium]|tara:strand:- start:434 stop:1579 length:1146 start_codon:yes stop_codon:yes gene_type:complete